MPTKNRRGIPLAGSFFAAAARAGMSAFAPSTAFGQEKSAEETAGVSVQTAIQEKADMNRIQESKPDARMENRIVSADLRNVRGPRSMGWNECVGAGRVGEALRATWREQFKECREELGFRRLRMHGLLEDELDAYSEDANGNPRYNFQYVDDVYDWLLSIGVKPFVEISFMPKALASGHQDATLFWWNANVTPPKDYAKWDALIDALLRHWVARYGREEVESWLFEIWNEPNLWIFWRPQKDPMEAYFELYEHTANAIRSVAPGSRIGGPAGAGPAWIPELSAFCKERNLPLDFISFHSYGLGDGPSGLDPYGNRKLYLNPSLNFPAETANGQLPVLERIDRKGIPVHITEWSSSYSPRDPVHDSYFNAPYILRQLRNTEGMASMSYWTFTDIFEENGPGPAPFHGGFGLVNQQGVRKASFWAYKFLSMLGDTEIVSSDPDSFVCIDANGGAQVLFWDLTDLTDGGRISNHDVFLKPHPAKEKGEATVRLSNLKPDVYAVEVRSIGYRVNDPYSLYLEMGRSDLTREDVAALKKASDGAPTSRMIETLGSDFELTLPLRENDVRLITLTPVATSESKPERNQP